MRVIRQNIEDEDELDRLEDEMRDTDEEVERAAVTLHPFLRSAVVERAVSTFLEQSATPGTPRTSVTRRGRWMTASALLAAAAVLLVVVVRDPLRGDHVSSPAMAPSGESLYVDARVRLLSAVRGGPPSASELAVAAGQRFYLECEVPGFSSLQVESVRATPLDAPGAPNKHLRFDTIGANGARLHVHAALPAGAWDVTCGVVDADGRFHVLRPAARLVVSAE